MELKTILSKDGKVVEIFECCVLIKNRVKRFYIKETGQYFENEKRAIRAANDALLRKTLPKLQYRKRQNRRKKLLGAKRILNINKCYLETKHYVDRWDGVIYLETKKKLLAEMKQKLDVAMALYKFKDIDSVNDFIKKYR